MNFATGKYSFTINQGSDLIMPLVLKDASGSVVNLGGYTVAMQIRKCHKKDAIDTLTTENGRIELSPSLGKITLIFPHFVTDNYPCTLDIPLGYDIEIKSGNNLITRILQGDIFVSPQNTRIEQ